MLFLFFIGFLEFSKLTWRFYASERICSCYRILNNFEGLNLSSVLVENVFLNQYA